MLLEESRAVLVDCVKIQKRKNQSNAKRGAD